MRKTFVSILLLATIVASAQMKTVVYFNSSESTLLPAARNTLDSLALALNKSGRYHLTIDGYCDSAGTHPGNLILGRDRAASVFDYLKKQGIAADSMSRNGHAESNPAAPGNDPASRAKNRRVEILAYLPAPASPVREKGQRSKQPLKFDTIPAIANLKVGQKLVLKNLNFENNTAILLPESISSIYALLKCMRDNPALEIKLSGHVCCSSDMALSVARARFVYDYLVKNDIDSGRMTHEGFSNTVPLLPNDEIDAYAAKVNRRVEITIMHK